MCVSPCIRLGPVYSVMLFSTGMTVFTEADPSHSRDQHRPNYASQVESLNRFIKIVLPEGACRSLHLLSIHTLQQF